MKIFYPETLAETVRETKTESEESDTKLRHYLLKKKPTLMLKRRQTMKNLQRMNQHSLDEEGREEDKEKEEPIAAGMDEDDEEKDVSAENETKEAVTGIPHISHYRR